MCRKAEILKIAENAGGGRAEGGGGMSRAVLISIRPKWCEKIAGGEKTIEVRRTRPKLETSFKVYIYCTKDAKDSDRLWVLNKQLRQEYGGLPAVCATLEEQPGYHSVGNGKVIGEFICDKIYEVAPRWNEYIVLGETKGVTNEVARGSCLSFDDMKAYLGEGNGYGLHISNLVVYDTPRELGSFHRDCKNDLRCESCAMYSEYRGTCGNAALQINRPPQSWRYVEELV